MGHRLKILRLRESESSRKTSFHFVLIVILKILVVDPKTLNT